MDLQTLAPKRKINKHGTVDPAVAKAHMDRDVSSGLRRDSAEIDSQSPSADLSIERRNACLCLYRIYEIWTAKWDPFRRYGGAEDVVVGVCGLFWTPGR